MVEAETRDAATGWRRGEHAVALPKSVVAKGPRPAPLICTQAGSDYEEPPGGGSSCASGSHPAERPVYASQPWAIAVSFAPSAGFDACPASQAKFFAWP